MANVRKNDALILEEIRNLSDMFLKHTTKIDTILFDENSGLCKTVKEHEKEISGFKYWKAEILGGAAILSLIIGYVLNVILR